MARFVTEFQSARSDADISYVVNDFLTKEGFTYTDFQGEMLWKKGKGIMTAPQFIKVECQNSVVHMEAWIKYPLLPGVYVGEMGLTGFFAFAVKDVLKSRVQALTGYLQPVAPQMPPQQPPQA